MHRDTLLFLETCAHIVWLSPFDRTLDVFFSSFFLLSDTTMVDFLPYWMHLSQNDDDNDNNKLLEWWWRYKRRSSKKEEEDRRRMRLWLFDRARCSSVSYGRVVIVVVVKALLLCVNRPWFLSFLCFPSCHSLYLSNRREFIELNESSTSVVFQSVFHSNVLENRNEKKILPSWS